MKQKNIKKRTGRILSGAMAVVLATGLLAQTTFATVSVKAEGTDCVINLGIASVASPNTAVNTSSAWSGDYIYYGNYYQDTEDTSQKQPVKWRVLDVTGENGISSENGTVLLQSDRILDQVAFNENPDADDAGVWKDSNLANWLNSTGSAVYVSQKSGHYTEGGFLDNAFSDGEKAALMISDGKTDKNMGNFANPAISGRKVFSLSVSDMVNGKYGFLANAANGMTLSATLSRQFTPTTYAKAQGVTTNKNANAMSWLRSFYEPMPDSPAIVSRDGYIAGYSVDFAEIGVVPAVNVKKEDIVFTSPAEEAGKDETKADTFSKVEKSDVKNWKLTLKDNVNFAQGTTVKADDKSMENGFLSLKPGYQPVKIEVQHSALKELSNQYSDVTAALISTDETGEDKEMLYYGSIQTDTNATSSTLSIPSGLSAGVYKLRIWGEDRNSAYQTDYASEVPYEVTVEVESEAGHVHVFGEWKNTTSCTNGTVEKRVCQICKYEETRSAQNRRHEWESNFTIDKPASCTEDGSQSIHCKYCNEKKEVTVIPATGHSGGYPTCIDRAVCKICNQEYGERLPHEFNDEKWVCDAGAHWHACTVCGSRKDIREHEWDEGKVIDNPLLTTVKIKVYTCKTCEMKKTVMISDNGEAEEPDDSTTRSEVVSTTQKLPASGTTRSEVVATTQSSAPTTTQSSAPTTTQKLPASGTTQSEVVVTTQSQTPATTQKSPTSSTTRGEAVSTTQSQAPAATQSPSAVAVQKDSVGETSELAAGTNVEAGGAIYSIISNGTQEEKGIVAYVRPVSKMVTKAVIPDSIPLQGKEYQVMEISDNAFKGCKKLKTVTVKDTVQVIGKKAFYQCKALTKVVLGKGVSVIDEKAFYGCGKLKQLKISSSQLKKKSVGSKAFLKAGSSNYKKLVVQVPKKKLTTYKTMLRKKGLSSKAKVRK